MVQKVAVPAVTIRKHAQNALAEADALRENGYFASARSVDQAVTKALKQDVPENPGQLISIEAPAASTLAAQGFFDGYSDGFRAMLEHQHYW